MTKTIKVGILGHFRDTNRDFFVQRPWLLRKQEIIVAVRQSDEQPR